MENCDVFTVKTEMRHGQHYVIVSGYPDGSQDTAGPFATLIEAEMKCADAMEGLASLFGDRVKKIEWEGQGES